MILLIVWTVIQSLVGMAGFYTNTASFPPRLIFMIGPPFLFILFLFITKRGRLFMDNCDPGAITLFHIVRIPVEIVLLILFLYSVIPETMTFEGRNFDILSGLTAPLVYWLGYKRNILSKNILILWNVVCLGLVLNVVIHGILSAPFPFQQLSFDQPNIGILYFPFTLLPGLLVPLVIFSHLLCLRSLFQKK